MNKFKVACAAALATLPAVTQAAVIIDTGPAPASVSSAVYGGNTIGSAGVGGRFTLTAATTLTAIEFYGASLSNNLGAIRADGATPGATLYSGIIGNTNNAVNQWVGLNGLSWVLGPGSYWLTFESPNSGSAFREAVNFPNPLAKQVSESANIFTAETNYSYAFRIQGDVIAAAVPEPASWAMLVAGFGLIGGAMRRHKVVVAYG